MEDVVLLLSDTVFGAIGLSPDRRGQGVAGRQRNGRRRLPGRP